MKLEFLSPIAALLLLGVVAPLLAFVWVERRAHRLRAALGLDDPGLGPKLPIIGAVVAIPLLLSIALAQPVIRYTGAHAVRSDVEVYYVFDVSRSMAAAESPNSKTRFAQAIETAERVHQRIPNLPSGVATLTDRVLPSLFPTGNDEVFTATVEDALAIGQPPPRGYDDVGTLFAAVDTFASGTFFRPTTTHRVVIIFTDGESRPFDTAGLRESLASGPPVTFVVVRIWNSHDRVWVRGTPVRDYRPDRASELRTAELVRATSGLEATPGDVGRIASAVRRAAGSGPELEQGELLHVVGLGRWFALACLVPLGYLLWRRNLG